MSWFWKKFYKQSVLKDLDKVIDDYETRVKSTGDVKGNYRDVFSFNYKSSNHDCKQLVSLLRDETHFPKKDNIPHYRNYPIALYHPVNTCEVGIYHYTPWEYNNYKSTLNSSYISDSRHSETDITRVLADENELKYWKNL